MMASSEGRPADPSSSAEGAPTELVIDIKLEPPSSDEEAEPHRIEDGGEVPPVKTEFKQGGKVAKERKRAYKKKQPPPVLSDVIGLPGLLIYNEFCLEMGISPDIKGLPPEELAESLRKFFFYVRLKPASVLEHLFEQMCIVVEFYREIRIRKDPRFRRVFRVYRKRLESLSDYEGGAPGEGGDGSSRPQITEQLSMFCLRKLLFCEHFRPDHPRGLFNLTLFYVMLYTCKGMTHWIEMKAHLTSMRKLSFVCKWDASNNLRYITFRRGPGCDTSGVFEVPGHPICPFKILRLYMSKLSTSSSYFWQRPKEVGRPNESWFYPDPSNAISTEWLLELTEAASMTVSYTNMSLVLTPSSVMDATLADPVFAQTIADEVKNIPEPPEYDASRPETALPGGEERVKIRLLSASEAQVEIRLTEIFWKELFPEWDRARQESGYQNHVDFMTHLLEVHRSCRAESCRGPGTEATEATLHGGNPTNAPINVTQHGIHNSSVLTVVNNNTIPQGLAGAQNVIVPLNDLLKSLGAGLAGVDSGATTNQNGSSGVPPQQDGAVGKSPPSQLELSQQLVQNAALLSQLGGTPLVLPPQPSGKSEAQPGVIVGNNNPLLPPQGTNAFTEGFQSVLPSGQPLQGLSSTQELMQAAGILNAASQSAGGILTSTLQQAQAGGGNLPVSTLLKIASGQQQAAAGVVPSSLLDTLANPAVLSSPQGLVQTSGAASGMVPSSLPPGTRVVGEKGTPEPLTGAQLDTLAARNPTGSTFVITSQGVIALPSLQQQQAPLQTVISHLGEPGMVVNATDVSMSTASDVTVNKSDAMVVPTSLTTSDPSRQDTSSPTPSNPESGTPGPLDLSPQRVIAIQERTEKNEVPLDLSVNQLEDSGVDPTSAIIPSASISGNDVTLDGDNETAASHIHGPNDVMGAGILPLGAPPLGHAPATVRCPPPPYPGISTSAAQLAGVQPGYPRFVGEPAPGDLLGFLKMTSLKGKVKSGKSVRELLDKKRKSSTSGASNGSPESGWSLVLKRRAPKGSPEFEQSQVVKKSAPDRSPEFGRSLVVKSVCAPQGVQEPRTIDQSSRVSEESEEVVPVRILQDPEPEGSPSPSSVSATEPHKQSPQAAISGRKSRRKPLQVFKRTVVKVEEGT